MTDPRPSENTDRLEFPEARRRGFFDFEEPADVDPIEELIASAQNAHDPGLGLVFAQLATVRAVQAQTEQMRIANRIALGQYRVANEEWPPFRHLVMEPRGEYAVAPVAEIREGLGL